MPKYISKIVKGNDEILIKDTAAQQNKEDKIGVVSVTSGTTSITTQVGNYYNVAGTVSALTINLPSVTNNTVLSALEVFFTTGSNTPTVTITPASGDTVSYFSGYSIEASKTYELNIMWNGTKWIVAYAVIS